MSYDKNTWAKGDVITAAKLNNMENGIESASTGGGGVLVVGATVEDETITLDKTWQQIHDSPIAILKSENEEESNLYFLANLTSTEGEFKASFTSLAVQGETIYTTATTADSYPIITE